MGKTKLTAIVGGIGAGKSYVSNILRAKGYDVYDCDSRAKLIIDNDYELRQCIARAISADVLFDDGSLNRPALATIVFNDADKLQALNSLVHGAVRNDVLQWRDNATAKHLFVETAILYQSGLDKLVDEVWEVVAPEDVRITRVMARNNITANQVRARIKSQQYTPSTPHPNTYTINNDGIADVAQQLERLLV